MRAANWKDYELIDTGSGERLERWGDILLIRPDPQIIWKSEKKDPRWRSAHARYKRSSTGGGKWEVYKKLPDVWKITRGDLTFRLKPMGFKHTGVFPEQAVNWDYTAARIRAAKEKNPEREIKILNLFGYTGAATLDRLFARRNLFVFIVFSAICVIALALIGDFGTAVIFFATFLVISFMRSGSFATVFLAVSGAAMAGFLVISVKPYIADRFSAWGHVWEDVWDKGYQQTHALSAAASGGLFGKGAGSGWLKDIFAAETDMVFGVVSEELGLIIAVLAMFAVIALALFAVRNAAQGRSTFYVIAGCAAVSLMMVQMGLNVFGSLDILPFTGVTFPFVSKGGTSLISCWMLLAFVKATDTRRDASFVVSRDNAPRRRDEDDEDYEDYDGEDDSEEAKA